MITGFCSGGEEVKFPISASVAVPMDMDRAQYVFLFVSLLGLNMQLFYLKEIKENISLFL
jgi:hypothetical protein